MIRFHSVKYKNFLSTGNSFTEVFLDKRKACLVVGENGSGKSTMLDALCFGLFGKGFRKVSKTMLVNSINGRHMVVEIEFSVGQKRYKVIRGAKPNIFEVYLHGKLMNQDANMRDYQEHLEKQILKLNYKAFTQVVILGSSTFTPFMQMSQSDRRGIIEDILDINIFSIMNDILKVRQGALKSELQELDYDIIQEVLNIMSYYDYSGILLSRRNVFSKLCAYNPKKEDIDLLIQKEMTSRRRHDKIWDFISNQNMKRASFCTEDFANFSKYGYFVRRILSSIHVHEAKFQFTFEPKHVIIDKDIEMRILQRLKILGNRRFISNIHIN